jgi:hypothetical protein
MPFGKIHWSVGVTQSEELSHIGYPVYALDRTLASGKYHTKVVHQSQNRDQFGAATQKFQVCIIGFESPNMTDLAKVSCEA